MRYRGVLFDLDGVIVSTDELHFRAWTELARREGIAFDRSVKERLRGLSRADSLEIFLESAVRIYTPAQKREMTEYKNAKYLELADRLTPDAILPGAAECLSLARRAGARVAVASSSRNAALILERTGLSDAFDAVIDGSMIVRSKPYPEVFEKAAMRLGILNAECLVVEDALSGVEAGIAAGSDVLAIGSACGDRRAKYRAEDTERAVDIFKILFEKP